MKLKIFVLLLIISTASINYSQLKERDNLLGPSIGFWAYNSVPTFGANYEYQAAQFGDVASLGIGGIFRYTAWTDNYTNPDIYSTKFTAITFGAQGNFNFNHIGDGRFVPFVGLVLGYESVSYSFSNNYNNYSAAYGSGFWLWAQGGARYFFTPKVAGVIRLAAGNLNFDVLELGVDFKF